MKAKENREFHKQYDVSKGRNQTRPVNRFKASSTEAKLYKSWSAKAKRCMSTTLTETSHNISHLKCFTCDLAMA